MAVIRRTPAASASAPPKVAAVQVDTSGVPRKDWNRLAQELALPLYWITDIERGDEMAGWSPDEALPAIRERGRHPLTVSEGISWLLQEPERLERNRCFMTIASRKPKAKGLDARTPAIWISNGTGRDGRDRKGAPKVGWCWAGNRHTWLGFASAAARH